MGSRRRTNNRKNRKLPKEVIYISILSVVTTIVLAVFFNVGIEYSNNQSFASQIIDLAKNNEKDIFAISKIVLYSSCDATVNENNNNAYWNLDVHQFTDIAIYLDNHSNQNGLTMENTIKELYIDNIEFINTPLLGSYSLYYKDLNSFGTLENKEDLLILNENMIQNKLEYNIISANTIIDTSLPNIYDTCNMPIVLEYLNQSIKKNALIPNSIGPLSFDGSLLKNTSVTLNSVKATLSFNINVVNQLGEYFVCNVCIDIPLENEENNQILYDGNIKKEINDFSYKFLKIYRGE